MSLRRKNVRKAVRDLLTNTVGVGERVYDWRVVPTWASEYPLVLVYTGDETIVNFQESPREYERKIDLRVEIQHSQSASADDPIQDAMDEIAELVEYQLYQDHVIGPKSDQIEELVSDVELKNISQTVEREGEELLGSTILEYEVTYYTRAVRDIDSPEVADFEHVHAEWSLVEDNYPTGQIAATDDITGFL